MLIRDISLSIFESKSTKYKYSSYLEVFVNELELAIKPLNVSNDNQLSDNLGYKPRSLSGGSFAGLEKSVIVKKSSPKKGQNKLINEITWLQNITSKDSSISFPPVVDFSFENGNVWYTMPFYREESLRQRILSGKISDQETINLISRIMNFLNKN